MNKALHLLFFLITSQFLAAQELPPIINFNNNTYQAGNQNWMINQDKNHFIYFANNNGLLEYNGANFRLFPMPNASIVRSVKCIDDRIYTGAYMSFGYWKRQSNGELTYTDLTKNIKNKLQEDEQFWEIIAYNQWVVFQSLSRIYVYDSQTSQINIIDPNINIYKLFKTSQGLFFHSKSGYYEIENQKAKFIFNNEILKNDKIVNVIEQHQNTLVFTQHQGVFLLKDNQLKPFQTDADNLIKDGEIYSAKKLHNQTFAIGTISQGLIILNENGQIVNHIKQKEGLSNNTVLSIFEDIDHNIWLGLDNGINCINYQSPIRSFVDDSGVIGTVYTSIIFDNKLYIGSNQGLFYKNYPSNNNFQLVNGTKGQVWSLFKHDNTLFCGHDLGTFVVNQTTAKLIYAESGTWKFQKYQNKIIQGNYYGLSWLEKINGQWQFTKEIPDFKHSAKHFEVVSDQTLLVNHEYKGLFRLDSKNKFEKIDKQTLLESPKKSLHSSIVKYNGTVYYSSKSGVFKFEKNEFVKDELLSETFDNDSYITGKMIVENNKLWLFTKNYIHYFTLGKLSKQLLKHSLSIPSGVTNSMPGYENLSYVGTDEYLIGTTDGFYVINPQELKLSQNKILVSHVDLSTDKQGLMPINLYEATPLKHNQNHLNFSLAIPFFNKYLNAEYQYFLKGYDNDWSNWQTKPQISYQNLPAGKYVFYAKGRISNQESENTIELSFEILPPWYKSGWAKLVYIMLLFLIVFYTNKFYNIYHNKKHDKIILENNLLLELKELENQKEIMKFQNEKLSEEVENKDKELAISNLNLVKKTELLNIIKDDLKNTEDINQKGKIKRIISSINSDNSDENTWSVFRESFDKADNDFLKKMKQMHPLLTPNDLRLCAYLRINLSSKEIAPLLNISVRSVEIKRYRLRKKMDLSHEQGLTEYILNV